MRIREFAGIVEDRPDKKDYIHLVLEWSYRREQLLSRYYDGKNPAGDMVSVQSEFNRRTAYQSMPYEITRRDFGPNLGIREACSNLFRRGKTRTRHGGD